VVYANERPIRSSRELLEEAELMDALGTGITGGDPSLRFRRLLRYLRVLKEELGPEHHVHLYCTELSRERLRRLKEEGLDEIRFHAWSPEPVRRAVEVGLNTGVELPSLPGSFRTLTRLLKDLEEVGCSFVNLNELEFSETNSQELRRRGFRLKSDTSVAVKGSEELALRVLEWALRKHRAGPPLLPQPTEGWGATQEPPEEEGQEGGQTLRGPHPGRPAGQRGDHRNPQGEAGGGEEEAEEEVRDPPRADLGEREEGQAGDLPGDSGGALGGGGGAEVLLGGELSHLRRNGGDRDPPPPALLRGKGALRG
jgi:hypothetical protein